MDKVIISNNVKLSDIVIDKDSYVIIEKEVQAKKININIIDCKATILDLSLCDNKKYSFSNSQGVIVEINDNCKEKKVELINDDSNVEYNLIDLGDADTSYDLNSKIVSSGSLTDINFASVSYKNKNKKYKIYTENLNGNSTSEISCFGIVRDESILNYDVSSFIKKGAKKSVVKQSSSILLFDEKSVGINNPILLIEENDVKASHGSSIGKIDDDTMFYLCSRGLTKNEATNLICLGKMEHLINKIEDKDIRESIINNFKERMG